MYVPAAYHDDDPEALRATIREARLCSFVTATAEGVLATLLPMFLDPDEGEHGTVYGHLARGNPQSTAPAIGEALAIFMGPEAYVSPSWYASKREHGKVVPTWNYVAVQAYGHAEFFDDAERLLHVVSHLTDLHEQPRAEPWAVTDAPEPFVRAQLRGIIGVRMPVSRIYGKRKMSQNRSETDRAGVAAGLAESDHPMDQLVSRLIP